MNARTCWPRNGTRCSLGACAAAGGSVPNRKGKTSTGNAVGRPRFFDVVRPRTIAAAITPASTIVAREHFSSTTWPASATHRSVVRRRPPHSFPPGATCTFSSSISANTVQVFSSSRRSYFTNTDAMNRSNPYHTLDLEWGATTTEIKEAFRHQARLLHPDVNTTDSPEIALSKFQHLQKAYSQLMDVKGLHRDDLAEEWSFKMWRRSDIIAQERTDVAGQARKRPAKPAEGARKPNWGMAALGHPDQVSGNMGKRRGEYLGPGDSTGKGTEDEGERRKARNSSTVGTGQNKWVKRREYKSWKRPE